MNDKTTQDTLILETTQGEVTIEVFPDVAPKHVTRIRELVAEGAYDNVVFHRVIEGFMAQTGDVQFGKTDGSNFDMKRVGMGGSDKSDLAAEFSDLSHERGVVSMARSQNPNSANSQFFICFESAPWLDKQYTIWGKVVKGMENIDKLKRGEPVQDPDKIVKAYFAG
ncbi:peptidylprolyl isomerase [Bartonella sp. DGB1]|uniref:peptidylprolyl isomerase n=1 Tax=Bartonella sp. DGB1 TaxID=3239807 RepID=UPI0035263386